MHSTADLYQTTAMEAKLYPASKAHSVYIVLCGGSFDTPTHHDTNWIILPFSCTTSFTTALL